MHMADAMVSPAVGISMLAASIGMLAVSIGNIRHQFDEKRIPLMGVMGAFIFAAQMVNFPIPGTGSSGHIGGAVLLTAVLGPYAAFLVLSCVLAIQALFFADGGLLALGCNIFNLGFFGCFLTYPLLFKPIAGDMKNTGRVMAASVLSVIAALQLGAFCVVLETLVSGNSLLPFGHFTILMQSIHLAIGTIEGFLSAMVIIFLLKSRQSLFDNTRPATRAEIRSTALAIGLSALVIGGGLSLLASGDPDGLEWSIERIAGSSELEADGGTYEAAEEIQKKTSFLPDYSIPGNESAIGTSLSGIVGALITLAVVMIIGLNASRKKMTSRSI